MHVQTPLENKEISQPVGRLLLSLFVALTDQLSLKIQEVLDQ